MRTLIAASAFLAATALSTAVFTPVSAHAQQSRQATDTQTEFRQGVRAHQGRHWSAKRHQIIRAERSTPDSGFTEGAGPRGPVR